MKVCVRVLALFLFALTSMLISSSAFAKTRLKETASLPFTVNLAPGDVLVKGSDRQVNSGDGYQQVQMYSHDRVIGSIGKLRSVILTGDACAVEVYPGCTVEAQMFDGRACLSLRQGIARVGRASYGDGSPIRLLVKTGESGALFHGGDLMLSKSEHDSTLVKPEQDSRYLFSRRASLVGLRGGSIQFDRTVRPNPYVSYSNDAPVMHEAAVTATTAVTVFVGHHHHGHHHHWRHHRHHHGRHHHVHGVPSASITASPAR